MPGKDVRVRLSAEGQAEVIAAFQKVGTSARTAGVTGAAGIGALNGAMVALKTQLLALLPLLSGVAFVAQANEAARWADELVRLQQQTGLNANELRTFQALAVRANVPMTTFRKGLEKFTDAMERARAGAGEQNAALTTLKLRLEDLEGKATAEQIEVVGKALNGLQDGLPKTTAFMALFGKKAADLVPLMIELGVKGLAGVREEAERLGLVFDEKLTASAAAVYNQIGIVQLQVSALTQRFVGGLAPALSQAITGISDDLGDGASKWEDFGKAAGDVLKPIFLYISDIFDLVGSFASFFSTAVEQVQRVGKAALAGRFADAVQIADFYNQKLDNIDKDYKRRSAERQRRLETPPPPIDLGADQSTKDKAILLESFQARLEVIRSQADAELKEARAAALAGLEVEKARYAEGLQSIDEHYAARLRVVEEGLDAEIAALTKRRGAEEQFLDLKARDQALAKTASDVADARFRAEAETARIQTERVKAITALTAKSLDLERRLAKLRGDERAEQRAAIQKEIEATDLLLKQLGERAAAEGESAAAARRRRLDALAEALDAEAAFQAAVNAATTEYRDFDRARAAVNDRVAAGILAQIDGEQAILDLEQRRLPTLRALAAALEAAAARTGVQADREKAEDFTTSVDRVDLAVQKSEGSLDRFRAALGDSFASAVTDAFTVGADKVITFGSVVGSVTTQVIASLQRLAAQLIATRLAASFLSALSAGGGSSVDRDFSFDSVTGQIPGKAGGGLIRGPGGPTGDKNLIAASDWEYVTRAAVVKQPGVLAHLIRLNRDGRKAITGFADGGLVGARGPAGAPQSVEGTIGIGLDPGLVLRTLETPQGQRVLFRTVQRSRRSYGRLLGGS